MAVSLIKIYYQNVYFNAAKHGKIQALESGLTLLP